jgi:DNA-binding LacI/PurR family transcriptional regulator
MKRSHTEQIEPRAGTRAPRPARPPAITDVAKLANVSYQTVSRVLNNHPSVRESTRARVLSAIDQLGYLPNNAARSLVTGRSQTLGVLALDVADWSGLTTLYGIERSARAAGYYVSVASLDAVDRTSVRQAVTRLAEQSVAGLLAIAPIDTASDALTALPADLPAVAIEGDSRLDMATVTVDQISGARSATEHLLDLGHETVFHVAGPRDWMQTHERLEGWRSALQDAGAELTMPLSGDWSAQSGYEVGRMLARIPELTAVFVGNDQMALGLLRALDERGLSVPGDVSIVGFDDIPESGYFRPPLTTVHQDFQEVGRQSLEMLLAQIATGARNTERRVIGSELIIRSSTGPARSR